MTRPWVSWLEDAERVLGAPDAPEDAVDAVVGEGLALAAPDAPSEHEQVRIARVIACLEARRAAVAAELGDLARRRAELERARIARNGYLNAPTAVPMD